MAGFLTEAFDRYNRWHRNRQSINAALDGNHRLAVYWVDQGADPNYIRGINMVDGDKRYVENWNVGFAALERGNTPALQSFLARGLSPSLKMVKRPGDDTSIHHSLFSRAVAGGNREAAQMLMEKGADITYAPPQGLTPLTLAKVFNWHDLAEAIEKKQAENKQALETDLAEKNMTRQAAVVALVAGGTQQSIDAPQKARFKKRQAIENEA